jgi:hypothetical protein
MVAMNWSTGIPFSTRTLLKTGSASAGFSGPFATAGKNKRNRF